MLASIPAMDLMASRASHGDWYFREEWGGTQYSAYVAGNGKVHYKVLTYATGSSRNFWAYTDENDITQGSRCWTQLKGSADQSVFLIALSNGSYRASFYRSLRALGAGVCHPER